MRISILTYLIPFFLISCQSEKNNNEVESIENTDSLKIETSVQNDSIETDRYFDYQIPLVDSIFQFYETSGAVANSPSDKYFNPADSGIYVFYTLFDKEKMKSGKYLFDEVNLGTLTTHTYRNPKYGWSVEDKNQTFILLQLHNKCDIYISDFVQVGAALIELENSLGEPIYRIDSTYVYLGKNKIVGKFKIKNGLVESLIYGRFNLADDIFEIDSLKRKEIIEKKLKGLK